MVDKGARPGAKYAFEHRRIDGQDVECVLLDSVQSQANRMEMAVEAMWRDKRVALPVIAVNFTDTVPDLGTITSLSAPHRVADAILRDSLDGKVLFRMSDIGRSFTDASAGDATALFKVCPTGLVFGLWDSTGPKGGLGAKFPRALVSEIVGVGASRGVKSASRIDPTGIVTKAAEVYQAKDADEAWTHEPSKAKLKDGKPIKIGEGKPSEVNHSNVPPSLDDVGGGVTIDHATHTVVLSLAGLRKLHFGDASSECRTVLAALGLLAVIAAESEGHDLRSRCLLVPKPGKSLRLEVVLADGSTQAISLDLDAAIGLYKEAVAALPKSVAFSKGPGEPLATLMPSPKLVHLVKRSRELAAAGEDIGEG